ncbi:hypothetical protein BGZ47_009284 [Haplosporangium gracile]|nr:hypothetical protein BGZ47_009284 [Haplosporangium gracile]
MTPAPAPSGTFAQKSAAPAVPDRSRHNRALPPLVRTVSAPTSQISVSTSSSATKRRSYINPPSVSTRSNSGKHNGASIQKSSVAHRALRVGHSSANAPMPTQAQVKAQAHGKAQAALAQVIRERIRPTSKPPAPSASSAPKVAPTQRHRAQATPAFTRSDSTALSVRRPSVQKKAKPATETALPRLRARPVIPSVPLFDTSMEITSPEPHVPDTDMDIEPEVNGFDMDPSFVSEYQAEIFAYKREMEIKHLPDPTYMDRQVDLSWHYRVRLIEWLVEVHDRFDLMQETMHLCINYLDRFLSKISIPIDQLQLAGTVALLLASKYEEIQSPAIAELSFLGGDAYPPSRIRQAEIGMLRALNYDMGAPGPMSFLRRISKVDGFDIETRTLAKYLVDVTLCDHRFIGVPSSMVAAVGYRASMLLLDSGEWSAQHEQYSGYAEHTLSAGINVLLIMLEQPDQTHQTLFNRYKDEKFMESSAYVQSLGLAKLRALHY